MKKIKYLFIVIVLFSNCKKEQNQIEVIDNYVLKIESDNELNESIDDYVIEKNNKSIGGNSVHEFTDEKGNLLKIISQASVLDSITDFNFYYKNRQLIFAKVYKFETTGTTEDTIVNSLFYFDVNKDYFDKEKLIKQVNLKEDKIDASIVLSIGEALTIEGLGTKKE